MAVYEEVGKRRNPGANLPESGKSENALQLAAMDDVENWPKIKD